MITRIECSQCGSHFGMQDDRGDVECGSGHTVNVSHDIRPNLEPGEILVYLGGNLATFTPEIQDFPED